MKFSLGTKSKTRQKRTILFVCVENAGRSQMAEGFFRKYATEGYEPISAGTKPTSQINPIVVQAMSEMGVNIKQQKPKEITEDMMRNSTKIVNMGCVDKSFCPTLFIPNLMDWGIEDPKGKAIEQVREIRDDIEQRVKQLVTNLPKDNR
jgi:arsenate reductase (thioredoxin)